MSKIRWGIISTAKIGTEKVIPAMQQGEHCEVVAIASRDLARAQSAAGELGISQAFGTYEELLADPNVDAILVNGPNEYAYNLDLAYVPGGASGGLVLAGGLVWRDTTVGAGGGDTYFGYNVSVGGKTPLGPFHVEALIRWSFLNDTTYDPNLVSLGLNYVIGGATRRR